MASPRDTSQRSDLFAEDRDELEKLLAKLGAAATVLAHDPNNSESQCAACLLTRSTYTEFYSVCELEGQVDQAAADQLRDLFTRILAVMPAGKYHDSVKERSKDFEAYCQELDAREEADTDVVLR